MEDFRRYEQQEDRARLDDLRFEREAQFAEESLEKEKKRVVKQAWGIFALFVLSAIALIYFLASNRADLEDKRQISSDLSAGLKGVQAVSSQANQEKMQYSTKDHLQSQVEADLNPSPSIIVQKKPNNDKASSSPEKGRLIVGEKTKTETIKVTSLDPNIDEQIAQYIERRKKHYLDYYSFYQTNPDSKLDANLIKANISIDQYLLSISLIQHAPIQIDSPIRGLELATFQSIHPTYTSRIAELPFCIVVPTYKNFPYFRYYFNLYTILQQNYTNYHVVITDDASDDGTSLGIEHELNKLDKSQRDKIVFIKNTQRVYHMRNIVEAVRGYCKSGQILMIVDGDDELIGTQVLHTFNAAFHETKGMSIYSNHLRIRKETTVMVGISQPYPDEIKQNNSYRTAPHYYSHLKATWVDLFQLIRNQSLQNEKGVWFDNAVDNAIFYSIFELSCERVYYIPEITYKYNYMTGNNVYAKQKFRYRKNTTRQILSKQNYQCVKEENLEVYQRIESYYK